MKLVFLTNAFYKMHSEHTEIEQKVTRPYVQLCIELEGHIFALPLRSNINHEHVFWTNKEMKCGVDFSKAVVVTDDAHINNTDKPYIRPEEFKVLKGQEYLIKQKFKSYIKKYLKAKQRMDRPHNKILCKYSTLQYFEEFIH